MPKPEQPNFPLKDMPPVHVRQAVAEDIPALQRIEAEAAAMFPPGTLPEKLQQPMDKDALASALGAMLLWVAEVDGAGVVGFASASRHGTCLHIDEMDVSPAYGRRGIGARLVKQVADAAKATGASHITLTTFAHLPWNAPFYGKQGFALLESLGPFTHLEPIVAHEHAAGLQQRVAMVRGVQ